jgi:inner membrane protein
MDPVSHAMIGSAVAALAPDGTHPAVVWAAMIGAEIPDIDFLVRFWGGRVAYLTNHRGPTHGLAVLPAHAALIAGLLHLIWPEAPLGQLFGWGLAGALSHVLFDFGNDYGTQGLWPFSPRRIARDIIPIVDLWILGLIGLGWLANWLWPGHRQLVFTAVWLALAAYVGYRLWLHRRARNLVAAKLTEAACASDGAPCGHGWEEEGLTVHPTLLSLNAWRYVVRTRGEYLTGMVLVREGVVTEPHRSPNRYDQIVQASLQSPVVGAFARWVRRPRVEVYQEYGFFRVRWSDMRYEVDGFSPFTAEAVLDADFNVVRADLGSSRPAAASGEMVRQRLRKEMGKI